MANNENTEEKENEAEEKTNLSHTVLCADGKTKIINNYSRHKAIKLKCMSCINWEGNPKDCTDKICPLYPFKEWTNLSKTSTETKAPLTEEKKEFLKKISKKALEKRKEKLNIKTTTQTK